MTKIDYKKELKHCYRPSRKKVELIDVPSMQFLMIDGKGDPNTSAEYQQAVESLFTLSYKIKFSIKKSPLQVDYGVMPLEGLWWVDDIAKFDVNHKEDWLWTMMIMQPDLVTEDIVESGRVEVSEKKELPALHKIRFEHFEEGKAAQIMHIGPFSEEGPTIQKVHDFIDEQGLQLSGKHHEIYLSDIRKAAPEKWRTIIRQPCR